MKKKRVSWKTKVSGLITKLRLDAIANEKINQRELKKLGIEKDVVMDEIYWNGYLDAMTNFEKGVKAIN